jgi:uncharacterized protein (DUF486 family)
VVDLRDAGILRQQRVFPTKRDGSWIVVGVLQLKTIQEVITLIVFAVFSVSDLREPLRWNHAVAFIFIVGAVFFMFYQKA